MPGAHGRYQPQPEAGGWMPKLANLENSSARVMVGLALAQTCPCLCRQDNPQSTRLLCGEI